MRFPVLLILLSFTLSGCLGFFEKPTSTRGLTSEELAEQQREAEAADALNEAMQLFHDGEYLDALAAQELLDKAISLDPTLTTALYQRAILYLKQRDREAAYVDLQQLVRIAPDHVEGQYALGFILFHQAKYTDAMKAFDRALANDGSLAQAYALRGAARGKLGQHDKAVTDLTKAIARNPAHREAYYNRGIIQLRTGDAKAAIHDLTQALSLDANSVDTLHARAEAYIKLKDYDRAVDDYTRAMAIDPQDSRTLGLLAEVYGAAGHYREAESAAHKAMLTARENGDMQSSQRYADMADSFAGMTENPTP